MEEFRGWVINICTAVFFITAVEMILPDNKMKKYAKFVLGLILMTVIINPLVKFLNRGADISTYIGKSTDFVSMGIVEKEQEKYREKSINETMSVFKSNLESLCEKKLKEKYSKGTYRVKAQVSYDSTKGEFLIKGLTVEVSGSSVVEKIKKIEVNANSSVNAGRVHSEMSGPIKDYLSSELQVSKDIINVYKQDT